MDRRTLLRNLGGLAAAGGFGLCCARRDRIAASAPGALDGGRSIVWAPGRARTFIPVRVDPSREIRTVVGLRPFRPSGFRVEAERFDRKLVGAQL